MEQRNMRSAQSLILSWFIQAMLFSGYWIKAEGKKERTEQESEREGERGGGRVDATEKGKPLSQLLGRSCYLVDIG